jgi:hypothetical protein
LKQGNICTGEGDGTPWAVVNQPFVVVSEINKNIFPTINDSSEI